MSGERRAKYKPVKSLVTLERSVEPSDQPAAVSPTNKPSLDHTHALSLSECSSLSSFVAQDQLHSDPVLSSVVEPKAAITVSNTSPFKVVRHDISDSVQTRTSSGVMTVVQSTNTSADQTIEKQDETVLNVDDDSSFHTPTASTFNDKFDDDTHYRFSTNFVTPPLRRGRKLTSKPFEAQDLCTVVKEKTTALHVGKLKQQDIQSSLSDDVTSATTLESSSTSLTELATLMQSVSNELGQMSVTTTSKQEKQMKRKKQKKGHVVPSRYMSSVKTKPVRDSTSIKPPKTTVSAAAAAAAGTAGRRPLRGHSPSVRQQIMMDTTLPTPVTFSTSAMISSTPAVTEQERTSHNIAPLHDGSYITARNVSTGTKTTNKMKKVIHHTRSSGEEDKQKREDFKSLRCSALQLAYLDGMIGKAIRQQEEQAKCQMYQLHSSLINIMDENKTLQNEIATLEHQMAVDATLHSQLQGLGAVVAHLPEVEPQYRKMAQSLDNTRHLMKTNGIVVPSEDELLVTVQRGGQLMDNLLSLIVVPQVAELAETSKAVEDMKATQNKALENNEKLTQETEDVQVEEASLRYHINLLEENYK